MNRCLTQHAIDRYRQRVGNRQTPVRVIQQVLNEGRLQAQPPAGIALSWPPEDRPHGYVLAGEAVFPVWKELNSEGRPVLVAPTCLKARKRSKAERRALRELAREEDQWVA